ncbi:MAG TPA: type II secretion system protein GspG [Polyangia bacterium]|nr:type II secretion system protein GspG [Polyangia bacterium]
MIRPLVAPRVAALGVGLVALAAFVPIAALVTRSAPTAPAAPVVAKSHTGGTERVALRAVVEAARDYQRDLYDASCPPSLHALVDRGYFAQLPVDEWGHRFVYRCTSAHPVRWTTNGPDVVSAGPDGRLGTGDDLRSWELVEWPRDPAVMPPSGRNGRVERRR